MWFNRLLKKFQFLFGDSSVHPAKGDVAPEASSDETKDIEKPKQAPTASNALPDLSHPVWLRLVNHQIDLKTKNYALQMLLSWTWKESPTTHNEDVLLKKKELLMAFFNKNQRILKNEINQLLSQGE